jgi:hypothetical protein
MTGTLFTLTFLVAAPFWALMMAPILLLTILLGPAGLFAYLAVRTRYAPGRPIPASPPAVAPAAGDPGSGPRSAASPVVAGPSVVPAPASDHLG